MGSPVVNQASARILAGSWLVLLSSAWDVAAYAYQPDYHLSTSSTPIGRAADSWLDSWSSSSSHICFVLRLQGYPDAR